MTLLSEMGANGARTALERRAARAPAGETGWPTGFALSPVALNSADAGDFDIAAIRPGREAPPPRAVPRPSLGRWGAALSLVAHALMLAGLVVWSRPLDEPASLESIAVEIVAEPPANVAPAPAPPAEAPPPPVAEAPTPGVTEASPPPVSEPPPPPEATSPIPAADAPSPPVAEAAPPGVVETSPRVGEALSSPVEKASPPPAASPPIAARTPPRAAAPIAKLPPPARARAESPRRPPPVASEPAAPSSNGPAAGAEASAYQGAVLGRIAGQKRYPEAARERAPRGVAIVKFSLGAAGQLLQASLAQSAGDPLLDAEALATVRRAAPFPPPPAGAPRSFSAALSYRVR